jgi:predicted DNA-binding transcriptional regulator AlpA
MPDLRELVSDPRLLSELTPAEAATMIVELASLQAAVAARLRATADGVPPLSADTDSDRLLSAADVAGRLGRSIDWVYRQAKHWPFTRRLTRRTVRFSEAGLLRWLATRRSVNSVRSGGMVGVSAPDRKESRAPRS